MEPFVQEDKGLGAAAVANVPPWTGLAAAAPLTGCDDGHDPTLGRLESLLHGSPQPLCLVDFSMVGGAGGSGASVGAGAGVGPTDPLGVTSGSGSGINSSSSDRSTDSVSPPPSGSFAWAAYAVLPGGLAAAAMPELAATVPLLPAAPVLLPVTTAAAVSASDGADGLYDSLSCVNVLFSNDALSQLCGYSRQQLRRGGLGMLLRPPATTAAATATAKGCCGGTAEAAQARRSGAQLLAAALASGSVSLLELPCYHSSGRLMWCSISISPVDVGGAWQGQDPGRVQGQRQQGAGGGRGGAAAPAPAAAAGGWRRHAAAGHFPVGTPAVSAAGCGGVGISADSGHGDGGAFWHGAACGVSGAMTTSSSSSNSSSSICNSKISGGSGSSGRSSSGNNMSTLGGGMHRGLRGVSGGIATGRNSRCECETGEEPTTATGVQQLRPGRGGSAAPDGLSVLPWQHQRQHRQQQQHCQTKHRKQQQQQQREWSSWSPQVEGMPVGVHRRRGSQSLGEAGEAGAAAGTATGSGTGGDGWRRSRAHEWARRCHREQYERQLRLRQLQFEEQGGQKEEEEEEDGGDAGTRPQQQQQRMPQAQQRTMQQQMREGQEQQQHQVQQYRSGLQQQAAFPVQRQQVQIEPQQLQQEQQQIQQEQQEQQQLQQQRRFLVIFTDVTAHKQLQQQLQALQQPKQQQPRHQPQQLPLRLQQQQQQKQCTSSSSAWKQSVIDTHAQVPVWRSATAAPPVSCPSSSSSLPLPRSCSFPSGSAAPPSLLASLAAGLASAGGCAACRLYDVALDSLREGITIADAGAPDQPVVYTNRAFLEMTGYSREEVLGRNCRFLQGADTDPVAVAAIRDAITRRQPATVTLLNYTRSGAAFWNELRLEPVLAPPPPAFAANDIAAGGGGQQQGQLLAIIGVQNDVTELIARKQSEAALRDAKEAAESATEAKSQFLANMSHEIRTPLNGMIATAQLLLGSTLTPEQRELAETVLESGSTLLGVLGDILDFSKIDHGSLELQQRPMCLRQATEACMDLVAAEAAKKGLALAYLMDDAALARPLIGDPVRIRQVLANLLSNAVKFTEHGEVVVRVAVEPAAAAVKPPTSGVGASGGGDGATAGGSGGGDGDGTVVHVSVSDTGIGISEESARKLFQHFRQGTETMSRRYGGTGLGLAISKRLAQLMLGDIWVESRPGVGSTFHFTLRAEWASSEAPWPVSPVSQSAASTPVVSSDCTPRSSTDEGNNSITGGAAAAAAAAALGLDSGNTGRWTQSHLGGGTTRLSNGSIGSSSSSGRGGGRELRTSPWMPDGTPIDIGGGGGNESADGGDCIARGVLDGGGGGDVVVPPPATPPPRSSNSGSAAAAATTPEVPEERLALVGRTVLIDVSHAATSTQVWNSCRQLGLAAAQANACALPQLPLPPPAAAAAAAVSPDDAAASDLLDAGATAASSAVAAYNILVVSMDRLVLALKAGWKGRPVVALGDRELLPPPLQPLVVALAVPVRHGRLATALVKATALLRWNGSSAPRIGNTPIPNESIKTLKCWRLKRGSDWDALNRRTSLDNSALERTNLMMRAGAAAAAAAAAATATAAAAAAGDAKVGLVPVRHQHQQAPIPEHAELPAIPDDSDQPGQFCFPVLPPLSPVSPPPAVPAAAAAAAAAALAGGAQPSALLDRSAPQQQQQQQPQPHCLQHLQPLRILIAEDNKVNQKVVLKVLQQILRGCQPPDVVENGLEVLQALRKKTYDLILMDIHMPEMDGLEASKRIQETYKPEERPRIIALSADTVQTLHDRCREAGIEAFLVKPFRIEELARVMRSGAPRSTPASATTAPRSKPLEPDPPPLLAA